jgi:hypothetical protein
MAPDHAWEDCAQIVESLVVSTDAQQYADNTYIFATDSLYNVIRGGTQQLGDDGELVDI